RTPRRGRPRAFRTGAVFETDLRQGGPATPVPWVSTRLPPVSSHPSVPASYRQGANSPIEVLGTLVNGCGHAFPDRFAHSRNREQEQRLLNCIPVFLGNQHRLVPLSRYQQRLV